MEGDYAVVAAAAAAGRRFRMSSVDSVQDDEDFTQSTASVRGMSVSDQADIGGLRVTDFTFMALLGSGALSRVYAVVHDVSNSMYALKVSNKDALVRSRKAESAIAEAEILSLVNHPFIVSQVATFQNSANLYYVLDIAYGGEMFSYIYGPEGPLSETHVAFAAAELTLALEYLHSLGIVYRDLKAENVLLDALGHVKLSDFGFAKVLVNASHTYSLCGTPEYLAPEILQQSGHTVAVDWWALGVLAYETIVGSTPFVGASMEDVFQNILTRDVELPPHVPPAVHELITGLLVRDPVARAANAALIRTASLFAGVDWDAMAQRQVVSPFTRPPMRFDAGAPLGGAADQDLVDDSGFDPYAALFEDF